MRKDITNTTKRQEMDLKIFAIYLRERDQLPEKVSNS